MYILLNAIFNDLLPSVILKSELQMWFNEKKKQKKQRETRFHMLSHFYFYFCKKKRNLGPILFIFILSLINSKSQRTSTEFGPPVG